MNNTIRVAQIMGKLWAGGVEMVIFNYYRAIDRNNIQFDFYYDEDSTVKPPQDLIEMGARFIKVPPYQKLPAYLRSLEKNFKQNSYLIVHSHINTLSVFPLYMAWKCGVPVRIAHNHSVPGGENFRRTFLKYSLRCFSSVFPTDYFCCSEKAGRWLFGNQKYDAGKVVMMKNAVNFSRFRLLDEEIKQMRNELGIDNNFVIGHVGRFTFAKNHRFLIETFNQIAKVREDAVLLLVGDGEMHDQIHKWVDEFELSKQVIFVGQVQNPEKYYCLADVMVIPSIFEGLSLATIESQVAGTPVVVSTAVPEEAIISNGVRRLELSDSQWIDAIFEIAGKKIELNEKSREYNIDYASKKLEDWYMDKIENGGTA